MSTIRIKSPTITRLCERCAGLKMRRCGSCNGWLVEDAGSVTRNVYDAVEYGQRQALDAFMHGVRPTKIMPLVGGMVTLMDVWTPAALTPDRMYLLPHECDHDKLEHVPSDGEQGALL